LCGRSPTSIRSRLLGEEESSTEMLAEPAWLMRMRSGGTDAAHAAPHPNANKARTPPAIASPVSESPSHRSPGHAEDPNGFPVSRAWNVWRTASVARL